MSLTAWWANALREGLDPIERHSASAIEEAATDGTSALFLKRFFDRTTRWMSRDEREWFTRTCYLDEVNEDTLRLVFPEEGIVAVQDWFEGEASIRDPS